MKIVLTGSLGNISKPLAQTLIQNGHEVTIISHNPDRQPAIEAIGASAAIGSMEDVTFLSNTFKGADAVYCMIPLSYTEPDLNIYLRRIANNYLEAIKIADIKRVVILSGWAADLLSGEKVEDIFNTLNDVSVTILRPASFYTNFYSSMSLIRGKGLMGAFLTLRYCGIIALLKGERGLLMGNCGGDDKMVFVSPSDIADAAAEELMQGQGGADRKIRYVGSEEMTCNEAAKIIGMAIGKPYLKWILLSDKEMLQGLKMAKVPLKLAEVLVEMQAVNHSGAPLRNFHNNKPAMGKVKLKDFAKEFAEVYKHGQGTSASTA